MRTRNRWIILLLMVLCARSYGQIVVDGTWQAEEADNPFPFQVFLKTDGRELTGMVIGIGAAVTRRPLPHHRAYGSVHGGSSRLR